jgi:hypothetical protein
MQTFEESLPLAKKKMLAGRRLLKNKINQTPSGRQTKSEEMHDEHAATSAHGAGSNNSTRRAAARTSRADIGTGWVSAVSQSGSCEA